MSQNLLNKQFVNVHISIMEEYYDLAYGVLSVYKFTGIEERLDELVITFESSEWNDTVREDMLSALGNITGNVNITNEAVVFDKNWNEEWEKNIEPIIVNERIAITPEWHKDKIDNPLKIIINPKMSFGTGHHATTRMVCSLMEKTVKPGTFWIDAGTGTGVLAILAIKLGAANVFAFDNNYWSINNSAENLELNDVSGVIDLKEGDIEKIDLPPADGILANLFINLVVPSFPIFYKSLKDKKGTLLVSGILKYDADEVIEAGIKAGFRHIETLKEDEWVGIYFKAGNDE